MHPRRIIFVYGSNHRLFDLVVGWSHKTSAARDVCTPSGDLGGLLTVWDRFMRLLPCATEFIETSAARDQPHWGSAESPIILIEHHNLVEVLVGSDDIHETDSVSGLMTLLEIRLEEWRSRALARARFLTEAHLAASPGELRFATGQSEPLVPPSLLERN